MESKYINKSLQKSFKILEILSQSVFPLKASSISRKAVMSRTTTFRLLSVLNQLGYIHKNSETNTYTMGHKAFQFGAQLFLGLIKKFFQKRAFRLQQSY